jgi:hypothetical protein
MRRAKCAISRSWFTRSKNFSKSKSTIQSVLMIVEYAQHTYCAVAARPRRRKGKEDQAKF